MARKYGASGNAPLFKSKFLSITDAIRYHDIEEVKRWAENLRERGAKPVEITCACSPDIFRLVIDEYKVCTIGPLYVNVLLDFDMTTKNKSTSLFREDDYVWCLEEALRRGIQCTVSAKELGLQLIQTQNIYAVKWLYTTKQPVVNLAECTDFFIDFLPMYNLQQFAMQVLKVLLQFASISQEQLQQIVGNTEWEWEEVVPKWMAGGKDAKWWRTFLFECPSSAFIHNPELLTIVEHWYCRVHVLQTLFTQHCGICEKVVSYCLIHFV